MWIIYLIIYLKLFWFFLAFHGFSFDRTAWEMTGNGKRERGDDMQQRAAGWTRTAARTKPSVHVSYDVTTELLGCPNILIWTKTTIFSWAKQIWCLNPTKLWLSLNVNYATVRQLRSYQVVRYHVVSNGKTSNITQVETRTSVLREYTDGFISKDFKLFFCYVRWHTVILCTYSLKTDLYII